MRPCGVLVSIDSVSDLKPILRACRSSNTLTKCETLRASRSLVDDQDVTALELFQQHFQRWSVFHSRSLLLNDVLLIDASSQQRSHLRRGRLVLCGNARIAVDSHPSPINARWLETIPSNKAFRRVAACGLPTKTCGFPGQILCLHCKHLGSLRATTRGRLCEHTVHDVSALQEPRCAWDRGPTGGGSDDLQNLRFHKSSERGYLSTFL